MRGGGFLSTRVIGVRGAVTAAVILLLLFAILNISTLGPSHVSDNARNPDYAKLINISFSFEHLPLVCQNTHPTFIVLVHSSPDNFDKRRTIRETWGARSNNVSVLFAIGHTDEATVRNGIAEEYDLHKDLLQGSFVDSYHNLTYKHVMVLKYAVYHCSEVKYIVKLDDDVFVNTPNLKEFIHLYNLDSANSTNILCSRMWGNPVLRSGRWGVPVEDFPEEVYPNHCSGFAIIYPKSAVAALYAQAQTTKYFWIDDAHVTGTLAKGAGLTQTEIADLFLTEEDVVGIVDYNFINVTKPFLFGTMNVNDHQIRSLWNYVKRHTPKASILDYLKV